MDLCFVETHIFTSVISRLLKKEEFRLIQLELLENPKKGDVIKNTGGARKIRAGVQNKGKRGGARIIYYYQDKVGKLWFLAAYMKIKKSNISEEERKLISAYVTVIKEASK